MDSTLIFNRSEFWSLMLGDLNITQFIYYTGWALAGAVLLFVTDIRSSIKHDKHTPNKFSFLFLVKDNILRILGMILLLPVAVIHYKEIFSMVFGWEDALLNWKSAVLLGLTIDMVYSRIISGSIKEIPAYKQMREKMTKKVNGH